MRKTIGQLQCLIRPGEDEKRVVVLLHGFGADASDLFPLADYMDPEGNWTFCFPEAPLEVGVGPMMSGRGWFPISVRDMEKGIDFTEIRPPGMDESGAAVYDVVFQMNAERLVLGGFSQGAMVSTEVALNNPADISALVLWSGTLLDRKNWTQKASVLKDKKFIQSHGLQDPVIPFATGKGLNDVLKGGGMKGGLLSFNGGHEIPQPVLQKSKDFLQSIFA